MWGLIYMEGTVLKKVIIFLIVILFPIRVNAYDKSLTPGGDATNILAWHQSQFPGNPSVPAEAWNYEVKPGRQIGVMGCSYFATSYMIVKTGEESPKEGFTPMTLIKNIQSKGLFREDFVDFRQIDKLYPNIKCEEHKISCQGTTIEQQLVWVKEKFNEGYFIILCILGGKHTAGHYIFVDGFTEDGDMIICDSAEEKDRWSDTYAKDNMIVADITLFSHKTRKANEVPSVYDGVVLGDCSLSEDEQEIWTGLQKEWELNGMPGESVVGIYQNVLYLEDQSSLSKEEIANLDSIKENLDGKGFTVIRFLNVLVSFLGICLSVYSMLLIVSANMDMSNNVFDISLVSYLTGNRCRVLSDFDYKELGGKKGEYTMKAWCVRCGIMLVIGLLLAGGFVGKLFSWFVGLFY